MTKKSNMPAKNNMNVFSDEDDNESQISSNALKRKKSKNLSAKNNMNVFSDEDDNESQISSTTLRRKRSNNRPAKNSMNVFSDDDEDTSQISSTTTTCTSSTFEPTIILHSQSRLINSMSIDTDSDSDSDFVAKSTPNKSSLLSQKKNITLSASKCKVSPQKRRRNQQKTLTQKSSSKKKSNVTTAETPKNSPKINIISNKRVYVKSVIKNKTKQTAENKSQVARNIFKSVPTTSTTASTQIGSASEESSAESVCSSTDSTEDGPKDVEVQTENNEDTTITSNVYLKRPLNVTTQTEIVLTIDDSSSDEEIEDEVIKQKVVQIKVTPPKRLKTIQEECSLPQKDKLDALKVNLTPLFQGTSSATSSKTPLKSENTSVQKSNSVSKNSGKRTPMKQLPITNFYQNRNTQSANATPNTSPVKSTPSTSPVKSTPSTSPVKSTPSTSPAKLDKSKKSPEKKETRYTKETHNRVFETVKKILIWVLENEYFRILFTKSETDLLKKLFDLPDKRLTILCIRLYTRQHKWYNLSNLCEELNLTYEGFNLKEFYSTLTSGFVCSDYSNEKIELLLDYLTLPDIKNICTSFKIRILSKKKDMINKLLEYSRSQCTLTSLKRADQILRDRVSSKLGICVKLETNIKDLFYRIHLLYSLTNPDLETPNDIYNLMYRIRSEIIKYPKVKIDSPQLFSDRQGFLKFAEACILRKEFFDTITKKDIPSQHLLCVEAHKRLKGLLSNKEQLEYDKSKPLFLRRFSAAWVYCKVLSFGSQKLGKPYPDDVCKWLVELIKQEIYCIHNRGHWYYQLALVIRVYKKDINGEVQSIIDGLSDKYVNEVQKHDLSIRGSKIRKAKISKMLYDQLQCSILPEIEIPISRTIQANVVHNNEPGRKLKFVRTTAEGKEYGSVEETAINYYTKEDNYTHGIHCEGQLLDALFIILFWDILYQIHIPNTFITEIQNRPLDIFSTDFYSNRTDKINERLKNIRDVWSLDDICEIASKIYTKYSLELKSIVSFDFVEEGTFHVIIKSIGKMLLAAIFERFAKDYKQFHSGLPDLFLWNFNELKCCFVEVKSENDRLSTKQILWINYLHKFGAKVEVCHVQHIGSSSTKKINKPKEKEDK